VVGQKLLEAVFGDQAVRGLAERARADLRVRVAELMAEERARYHGLLDALELSGDQAQRLREAGRAVAAR